jgi:hypothetical protein
LEFKWQHQYSSFETELKTTEMRGRKIKKERATLSNLECIRDTTII